MSYGNTYARRAAHSARRLRERVADLEATVKRVILITEGTYEGYNSKERPWTALSQIQCLTREVMRRGGKDSSDGDDKGGEG
jgi:hypothetical protein